MKLITMSVKEHILTDDYVPKFTKYDYIKEFDFESEDDIENIYEHVNLFVHTYYTYHDYIRHSNSFETASAIFLDLTQKHLYIHDHLQDISPLYGSSYNPHQHSVYVKT